MQPARAVPETGERPVVLVAPWGPGGDALRSALLASPGAWDASSAFAPWVRETSRGGRPQVTALAEAVRACRDAVDWSRLPGDAEPRMLVTGDDVSDALGPLEGVQAGPGDGARAGG